MRGNPFALLRPHEQRVLYYAARGLTNPEIARLLGISVGTVKNARYQAYLRLDVRTGPSAILLLLRAAQRAGGAADGVSDTGDHRVAVAGDPRAPRHHAA